MDRFLISGLLMFLVGAVGTCSLKSHSANKSLVISEDIELTCDREKLNTISVINEIAMLRLSNDTPISENDKKNIHTLVESIREKEELIGFAKASRALTTNTSGELECNNSVTVPPLRLAFWHSISILSQDKSNENIERMRRLKTELQIDGGDAYDWSSIVDGIPAP